MSATSPPATNARRLALGLIGLVLGLVILVVGLNALSTSDAPPADTPQVQTGSLPPSTARETPSGTSAATTGTAAAPPSSIG